LRGVSSGNCSHGSLSHAGERFAMPKSRDFSFLAALGGSQHQASGFAEGA
jgi:hypothetical protein